MASEVGVPVDLYIYDLTNGLAAALSPSIIGRQIAGVWHTAVVVYEREYFYGAGGVTHCEPGGTQMGAPHQVERLGSTFVPRPLFADYIRGLSTTTYTGAEYRLLEHNCNHFSDEVAQFLCGARVPKHILQQPAQLPPALRLALSALLDNMLPAPAAPAAPAPMSWEGGARGPRADSPDYLTLNHQIEQARAAGAALEQRRSTLAEKLARKQRRQDKRRHKHAATATTGVHHDRDPDHATSPGMADGVEVAVSGGGAGPSSGAPPPELDERHEEEQRRPPADPPIVYTDIDGSAEFEKLSAALAGAGVELGAEDRTSLEELQQYLVQGEGSWVLGDDFLAFIGRILSEPALSGARVCALRCLAACALREDVSLVLHQDRRHHALLSYAHRIDTHPPPEQEALALFMCNLFSHVSSSEWLLYISEWAEAGAGAGGAHTPLSNIRVTTKVCVHAALSEEGSLRELGTALMHNVATKEVKTVVFDEVCVELGMALLQLLQWAPSEEHTWRALRALARLAQHSADVPQLVAMVGPDPAAFRGTSARIDEQIDLIAQRLK